MHFIRAPQYNRLSGRSRYRRAKWKEKKRRSEGPEEAKGSKTPSKTICSQWGERKKKGPRARTCIGPPNIKIYKNHERDNSCKRIDGTLH